MNTSSRDTLDFRRRWARSKRNEDSYSIRRWLLCAEYLDQISKPRRGGYLMLRTTTHTPHPPTSNSQVYMYVIQLHQHPPSILLLTTPFSFPHNPPLQLSLLLQRTNAKPRLVLRQHSIVVILAFISPQIQIPNRHNQNQYLDCWISPSKTACWHPCPPLSSKS